MYTHFEDQALPMTRDELRELDYEDWCRERDEEWETYENAADGDCCRCGEPVVIEGEYNVLDDGTLVHRVCRAACCDFCGEPGDLVQVVGGYWTMSCLKHEMRG